MDEELGPIKFRYSRPDSELMALASLSSVDFLAHSASWALVRSCQTGISPATLGHADLILRRSGTSLVCAWIIEAISSSGSYRLGRLAYSLLWQDRTEAAPQEDNELRLRSSLRLAINGWSDAHSDKGIILPVLSGRRHQRTGLVLSSTCFWTRMSVVVAG